MQLTAEGDALLRYCQGVEDLEGQALSHIGGAGHEREVHVSLVGPSSVMAARVIGQCIDLYGQWPQLHLHFIINDRVDRLNLVRTGEAALAIVPPEQVPNEMDSKMLKPDRYILVASGTWRGRRLNEILEKEKIIDFEENDTTTLSYLKKFDLLSKVGKSRVFAGNNEAIIQLFAAGVGFGTLTQEIARPHLASGKLITLNNGAVMEDPLALAWYPRPEMPPYLKAIIQTVK